MKAKSAAPAETSDSPTPRQPLPVTLLSGFLGSGKTTLLQHILRTEHGLRIAVVVNDIGAINVDASLIKRTHHISQTQEKVIALQNGCICCTLRGDLLEELVRLAELQAFDYVIIESSGISEPEQVAETFDARLAEHMQVHGAEGLDPGLLGVLDKLKSVGGLEKFAKLDTCVTVIDAFNILADFSTADLLSHRRDDVTPEDERTISELMVDQIEFANVVVLNKTDLVSEEQRGRIRSLIRSLNHDCAVLETHHGRVDVHAIVNTGLFDLDKARVGYGWLQDLNQLMLREVNGKNTVTPKPETEEYGVRNFAYVRHRPFHPRRLWKLVYQTFVLQLDVPEDGEEDEEDEEEAEDEEDDDDDDGAENVAMVDPDDKAQAEDDEWEDEEDSGRGEDAHGSSDGESAGAASDLSSPPSSRQDSDLKPPADDGVILANKKAHPLFAGLFRSKGEFFLATRPHRAGEWSQAGAMLKLVGGREWFCVLPEAAYLTGNAEIDACTRHDIAKGGEWGDRRQELVFIGEKLDMAALERELDACLLTEAEFAAWAKIMRRKGLRGPEKLEKLLEKLQDVFDDGFPDWPGHEEWVDVDDDGHGHAHSQKTTGDAV